MFYHAKNGNVRIGGTDMDYVSFGKGKEILGLQWQSGKLTGT